MLSSHVVLQVSAHSSLKTFISNLKEMLDIVIKKTESLGVETTERTLQVLTLNRIDEKVGGCLIHTQANSFSS